MAEHGLSVMVEAGAANVLFDTGEGISASYNADILGIDLSRIDRIVLSHGHHDHTGGLRQILGKIGKEVEVIAHPGIWAAKYSRSQGQKDRYNGIPFQRQELERLGANFSLATKPVKIADNIMTTGEVPMVTDFEVIEPVFFTRQDSGWQPDELLDDQALIIDAEPGLVVILGCAHRGIINTLYHAQQLSGKKSIYMVIGGSHLIHASEERIRLTFSVLKELGVQRLGLCHCTSLPVTSLLVREFGDKFSFNNAGTQLTI